MASRDLKNSCILRSEGVKTLFLHQLLPLAMTYRSAWSHTTGSAWGHTTQAHFRENASQRNYSFPIEVVPACSCQCVGRSEEKAIGYRIQRGLTRCVSPLGFTSRSRSWRLQMALHLEVVTGYLCSMGPTHLSRLTWGCLLAISLKHSVRGP